MSAIETLAVTCVALAYPVASGIVPQYTTESVPNPVPVTVKVKGPPPEGVLLGISPAI